MKVFYLPEVADFVEKLRYQEHTRLTRVRKLFEEYSFQIGAKYIKKITASGIWELKAGRIRLFLYVKGDKAIGVHIIWKKSQKLTIRDIKLAERRSKQL